jgi:hypothetical protein
MCEGYGLEVGEVYRCQVVRHSSVGEPDRWDASINLYKLGPFADKVAAFRAVEHELELGMKRLQEDWAVFQATKILGIKKGKRGL